MDKFNPISMKSDSIWEDTLKEEFGEAFEMELVEADHYFKAYGSDMSGLGSEEIDFDLEDPYGDSF